MVDFSVGTIILFDIIKLFILLAYFNLKKWKYKDFDVILLGPNNVQSYNVSYSKLSQNRFKIFHAFMTRIRKIMKNCWKIWIASLSWKLNEILKRKFKFKEEPNWFSHYFFLKRPKFNRSTQKIRSQEEQARFTANKQKRKIWAIPINYNKISIHFSFLQKKN